MIKTIQLKFGRTASSVPETIQTNTITVFVGPNNSGKSLILSEINRFCRDGIRNGNNKILENIEFVGFEKLELEEEIEQIILSPAPEETIRPGHVFVGKFGQKLDVDKNELSRAMLDPNSSVASFCQWYLRFHTIMFGGENRISLVNEQKAGDLQALPRTSFQALFKDDQKRSEVRRIIYEAFGLYLVIDPTNLGRLRLKLSKRAPEDQLEERGIHQEAIDFHSKAEPIEHSSDGIKSFTGMITEIIAGDPNILLIDEPEAYLHPSLSYKLGKEISDASSKSNQRIFVSTHSSNFLMGCIQSGVHANIVRLTYRDGTATARILPNNEILRLMRNPLMRSTGVMEGIFYEFVVVTESDADRAFYQEINDRLLRYKPDWGIPNCLFINAQNKQTIHTIIKPLRELGIPAAGIVDVDIIKESGSNWKNFLAGGFVPEISHQPLSSMRSAIRQKLDNTGQDMKKDGGINLLMDTDLEAANSFIDQLGEYGLFVIKGGELESWLKFLGSTKHGPRWLIEVFEKMGEDPNLSSYLLPEENDVWEFISKLKKWLIDPQKRGIPD